MKQGKEIVLSLLFFAIYSPIAAVIAFSGDGGLLEFAGAIIIGVIFIDFFLFCTLIKRKLKFFNARKARQKSDEKKHEKYKEDFTLMEGFRNLFGGEDQ